ncbi:hypothetical protein GY45DRAFT_6660 [Cubamyces sp. BRFM 1775]|nr:hypothetical protein GY45DRAFT_6660 [Cubamyces sp. BRFM 1775]
MLDRAGNGYGGRCGHTPDQPRQNRVTRNIQGAYTITHMLLPGLPRTSRNLRAKARMYVPVDSVVRASAILSATMVSCCHRSPLDGTCLRRSSPKAHHTHLNRAGRDGRYVSPKMFCPSRGVSTIAWWSSVVILSDKTRDPVDPLPSQDP